MRHHTRLARSELAFQPGAWTEEPGVEGLPDAAPGAEAEPSAIGKLGGMGIDAARGMGALPGARLLYGYHRRLVRVL
jgi:hypothetical protein